MELPKIVAVDFDGTLVKSAYPGIGEVNIDLIQYLRKLQEIGYRIILWTCRNGQHLEDAIKVCREHGLHFDKVNENLDEVKEMYGGDTRKVFADIYLDDKARAVRFD